MNLQTGAFGNPQSLSTLILFWRKMNLLHYPGAGETLGYLEQEQRRQEQLQAVQIQMQARQAAAQQAAELAGQVEAAALGNAQTGGGAIIRRRLRQHTWCSLE